MLQNAIKDFEIHLKYNFKYFCTASIDNWNQQEFSYQPRLLTLQHFVEYFRQNRDIQTFNYPVINAFACMLRYCSFSIMPQISMS